LNHHSMLLWFTTLVLLHSPSLSLVVETDEGNAPLYTYASPIEATDSFVDYLFNDYPSIGPYDEEEARQLKKEIIVLLLTPPNEQDKLFADLPSSFKVLPSKMDELKKIVSEMYPSPAFSVPRDVQNENERLLLLYFLTMNPVLELEQKRRERLEKLRLPAEEIERMREDGEDRAFENIYQRPVSNSKSLKRKAQELRKMEL
ncbi:hypothetical protein PFISCL1PPCAC_19025, partial [Pristionchus fissidentatus]